MFHLLQNQPAQFRVIFLLELWERFGYYTVQGLLVVYFIRMFGYSDAQAYQTFGAFFALIYAMVALGGFLGDRVLGTKRTLLLGFSLLCLGYLALAYAPRAHLFTALGLVCVGNGLFKANPASLLSKCYQNQTSSTVHAGFTLYYMSINIGAVIALFVGPWVASRYGYTHAFFLSCLGMLLGLGTYVSQRAVMRHIHTPADDQKPSIWLWAGVLALVIGLTGLSSVLLQHVLVAKTTLSCVMLGLLMIYVYLMVREERSVRLNMLLALILMFEAVIFFTLYQQMPTSINLFSIKHVSSTFYGLTINPLSFQALNPIGILVFGPMLAVGYLALDRRNIQFAVPYKFALGMTCCGLSFLILYFSRYLHDINGFVSPGWLVISYVFQTIGELLVSALGVAMVSELIPRRIEGFVMGMWFLTSSAAGLLGASVASLTTVSQRTTSNLMSLTAYTHVFLQIGVVTLAIAMLMWVLAPRLTRLTKSCTT